MISLSHFTIPAMTPLLPGGQQLGSGAPRLRVRTHLTRLGTGTIVLAFLGLLAARATTQIGPWEALFKGVDHSVSTNIPSADGMPHLMVIHAIRIDTTDPDIQFLTTPRAPSYSPESDEVGGLTVSDFLKTNHVQLAINANLFDAREYYLPAGTPMDVYGLAISQGVVVSAQESSEDAASITFDASNHATLIPTNWPPVSTAGIYTAVSGTYPVLLNGQNISYSYLNQRDVIHDPNPRTAFGLSADRRYLFLMTIDGRQPGYSQGAYDYETAEWLQLFGAADGVNLDGGGSTTLVIEDSTGFPLRLNSSSAVADSGRERTVGNHFGVFAKAAPSFISDISVTADDTTAHLSWTTSAPASGQVQYGITTDFGQSTTIDSATVTLHTAGLAELTPATGYYYQILATTDSASFASPTRYFVTTNYVTTNQLFGIDQSWKFTTSAHTSPDWTSPGYDDSAWSGPGPGLLWVDTRATGPNSEVTPRVTAMAADPGTGYPYTTYYFRTHFVVSNLVAKSSLQLSGYIDDGAIFYLNGQEVYRLRMPSGTVTSQTLAQGYPCSGDATCVDQFTISADTLGVGDNVLAAEVHNYNLRSADITFGALLGRVEPLPRSATLQAQYLQGTLTLSWQATGVVLQTADAPTGPWVDVPASAAGQYVTSVSDARRYFKLRR